MRVYWVDTFTSAPFGGNPAAVCLLGEKGADDAWMQRVAAELNQPATAFLASGGGRMRLRWFTPSQELPLCGHGTLATAHVLFETGRAGHDKVLSFGTGAGTLPAWHERGRIWMDFPAVRLTEGTAPPEALAAAGLKRAEWFGRSDGEYVIQVSDPLAVEQAQPDFGAIRQLPVTRLIVTAPGGEGADFTSRVFVPKVGLDEDQVTGSAHAVLGPMWAARQGGIQLTAIQASRRRGKVLIAVHGDRVHIGGSATIVVTGELTGC
jgi:predicted PhzF superfamily epimerase YddE/YHI9